MTHRRLAYLKYQVGLSTQELMKRFPRDIERVSEVALIELPRKILQKVIKEKEMLDRLMLLKKSLNEKK